VTCGGAALRPCCGAFGIASAATVARHQPAGAAAGVTLFERTSRRVELTPAGARSPGRLAALRASTSGGAGARSARGPASGGCPGTGPGCCARCIVNMRLARPGSIDVVFPSTGERGAGGQGDVALLCASEDVGRWIRPTSGWRMPSRLLPEEHRWATRSRLTPSCSPRSHLPAALPRVGVDELVERVRSASSSWWSVTVW